VIVKVCGSLIKSLSTQSVHHSRKISKKRKANIKRYEMHLFSFLASVKILLDYILKSLNLNYFNIKMIFENLVTKIQAFNLKLKF